MILKKLLVISTITVAMCSHSFAEFSIIPKVGFNSASLTRDNNLEENDRDFYNRSYGTAYKIDVNKTFRGTINVGLGFGNTVTNLHKGQIINNEYTNYEQEAHYMLNELNVYSYVGYSVKLWKFAITPKLGLSFNKLIDATVMSHHTGIINDTLYRESSSTNAMSYGEEYEPSYSIGVDLSFLDKLVLDLSYAPNRNGYEMFNTNVEWYDQFHLTFGYKLSI